MMNLMTGLLGLGGHLGGWRHRDSWTDNVMNLDHAIETARTAERGKFDLLFLADGNAVRQMDKPALFAANSPSDRPAVFEPVTLLAVIAQYTHHIGLLATATTTYDEPYLVAWRFASLDHLSKGRACWNIVTASYPDDALNFSRTEHVARGLRYERAREFVPNRQRIVGQLGRGCLRPGSGDRTIPRPVSSACAQSQGQTFSGQGAVERRALPTRVSVAVFGRPVGGRS
jgi:alkanesulfonate monooxygenase SsuD/methylene tetrahydromethanopterin reductase-like flavin-dependent oxidoreductase (luciferase family)